MYMHRTGFHPPNETMSCHSRKRYRLVVPTNKPLPPGTPSCDPSLWLIHYTKAERRDHYPATNIAVQPQIQTLLRERAWLQRQGQLTKKEFMLHDKNNWPTINFPGLSQGQTIGVPGMPAQPGLARGGPLGPAPTRAQARQGRGNSVSIPEPTLEEEEDVSRGDVLDFLTPRDISRMRYEQHHEWMEELVNSPYSVNQIVPVELGLGRKGALEDLTNGFFTAPTSAIHEPSEGPPARVGKMDPEKVEQFRLKAEEKLASINAELEQMKKEHAKRMSLLERSSVYVNAERKLRNAVEDPAISGNQALRLEKVRQGNDLPSEPLEKIADIVAEVESQFNRLAVPIPKIACIQKGGLEEKTEDEVEEEALPSKKTPTGSPEDANKADVDEEMSNVVEQEPPQQTSTVPIVEQEPVTEKPKSPIPTSAVTAPVDESAAATDTQTAQPAAATTTENVGGESKDEPSMGGMDVDVDMGGLDNEGTAEAQVDDWVMVNEDEKGEPGPSADVQPNVPNTSEPERPAASTPGFANTPGSGLHGLTPAEGEVGGQSGRDSGIDTGDFDIQGNFENIDTAGEAMDSYDAGEGDLDLGDLDNSAFGEAFHPADHGEQPAEHEDV